MKKRQKKYNPNKHKVDPNSAFMAISLSKPVSDTAKVELITGIHLAIKAFARGMANPANFDTLAQTVDLSMMLSQNIFERAYMNEILDAREAMFDCKERYMRTGKFGFSGTGFNAVKFVAELHEEQLNHITGAEVIKFLEKRRDHIRSGNYYRGPQQEMRAAA